MLHTGPALHAGTDASPGVTVRALASRDSLVALTDLLHAAYAPLLARGMNFTASTQSLDVTRKRAADGQCFVAERGGVVVGTVTACGPYDEAEVGQQVGVSWYRDPDLAHFQQFAVHPNFQRLGVGRLLVAACEKWAGERGFAAIALDTAEPATELMAMYRKLGYTRVGFTQWPGKTYRSVVMRKRLGQSALREHLQTLARYNQWATQRLFESVDLLDEAAYRRNVGLFFGSLHGTLNHLLLGEHVLWAKRFNGEPTPVTSLAAEVEPDRTRLKQGLLQGAAAWVPWLEAVSEQQLMGPLHYRRASGEAMSLPFAATLMHVFNHGTHHRGQITAALTSLGQASPELDLVYMLLEEGAST